MTTYYHTWESRVVVAKVIEAPQDHKYSLAADSRPIHNLLLVWIVYGRNSM